eukprot:GHVT01065060.1.p1 GENE.GHVT01065060.1~~GHVT01065060.1.p1  ORF type:complete len:103 (+),score=9.28 GHVT01065060.1:309-617(+)
MQVVGLGPRRSLRLWQERSFSALATQGVESKAGQAGPIICRSGFYPRASVSAVSAPCPCQPVSARPLATSAVLLPAACVRPFACPPQAHNDRQDGDPLVPPG